VFPLGSGKARLSVPAPGPWPEGEAVAALPTGDIVRLADRRGRLQIYSARTGHVTLADIPALALESARPGAVTMESRPDGLLFVANAAIGRAVIADWAEGFRTVSVIKFPPPAWAASPPLSKAMLSWDGRILYVTGSMGVGGLSAYDVATGGRIAYRSDDTQYTGIYQLPSRTILATKNSNPRLHFFTQGLNPIANADTALNVAAVF
jgi:hypothetical protein